MPITADTFRNIRRLNKIFALAAIALLAALIWAIRQDHQRQWRQPQREAKTWDSAMAGDNARPAPPSSIWQRLSNRIRGWPLLQFINPTERVRQDVLDDVWIDLSFAKAAAVDRCATCHVHIDQPAFERENVIAALERETSIDGFWDAWAQKLLSPPTCASVRRAAMNDPQKLRAALRQQLTPQQYRAIEERYRIALIDAVNILRRQRNQPLLDPSPVQLAHPKLELFLGPQSPHAKETVGCTSCHDGSGGETDFLLAAHTARPIHVDTETGAPVLSEELTNPESDRAEYVDPATQSRRWAVPQAAYWQQRYHPAATLGGPAEPWPWPMRTGEQIQANCVRCHNNIDDISHAAPALHRGRTLFVRSGCVNCHDVAGIPAEDKPRVGPDLNHVSQKLSAEFIEQWIWSPAKIRPGTRMPRFFGLENNSSPADLDRTRREAAAMAAYLASDEAARPTPAPPTGDAALGRKLYDDLGCLACHGKLDAARPGGDILEPFGPSLTGLAAKLTLARSDAHARAWLFNWLLNPRTHDAAALMPQMRLSDAEAANLVGYLMDSSRKDSHLESPTTKPATASKPSPQEGKALIAHYGCMNCHRINGMENQPAGASSLSDWGQKRPEMLDFGNLGWPSHRRTREQWLDAELRNPRIWDRSRTPQIGLKMPAFDLPEQDIAALSTYVLSNRDHAISPALLAQANGDLSTRIARGRQTVQRRGCLQCHSIESNDPAIAAYYKPEDRIAFAPPSLRGQGCKTRPQWLFEFLKTVQKIRPQPLVRMPTFALSDDERTAIVSYFSAACLREASDIKRHLAARAAPSNDDSWFSKSENAPLAAYLQDWALARGLMKPVQFDESRNTHAELARSYRLALFKARFVANLYDAPYPFAEPSHPAIDAQRFEAGQRLFLEMQCLKCHTLGDPSAPGTNPAPIGPNLANVGPRLQRRWMAHWVQEPPIIQADARMTAFFSGEPADQLAGQPWPLSQNVPKPIAQQVLDRYRTPSVQEQKDLLLDFVLSAGDRSFTCTAPAAGK